MKPLSCTVLIYFLIIFPACDYLNKQGGSNKILPSCTGKPGELIAVLNDDHWNLKIGKTLKSIFLSEHFALPQTEPIFNLAHVNHKLFTDLLTKHRNILILKTGAENNSVNYQKNIWANNQVVVELQAVDENGLDLILQEKSAELVQYYNHAELNRLWQLYKKTKDLEIEAKLLQKFKLKLTVPKSFYIAVEKEHFIWLRNESQDISHGIMIYESVNMDTFSDIKINAMRDSVTNKFILGKNTGSFMKIENLLPPQQIQKVVNNLQVVETRGLWKMENDFMGGPFINYFIRDKKNNRLLFLDGYVYAPKYKKREYLRQVEAVLAGFQL